VIGGRWAVVALERPNGPVDATILSPFYWHPQAEHELSRMRKESVTPKLLGLATCAVCGSSDEGCERCNPEGESCR
jgi:hypothetical protein